MVRTTSAATLVALLALATPAVAEPGALAVADPARAARMLARLPGQRARVEPGRLVIDDVAGEGRPWIGVVERRGSHLWLVADGVALRLVGPLARPRLAGPGYTIWAAGATQSDTLVVRRLGVLAPPAW